MLAPHHHAVDLQDFIALEDLAGHVRDAALQNLLYVDPARGVGVEQEPEPDIPLVRHLVCCPWLNGFVPVNQEQSD